MSLVQAYINENFILVCGEQKATFLNGTVVENFRKVYKLNDTTIIGMSGTIEGNYTLFSNYINQDFILKGTYCSDNYKNIENRVIDNFYKNYKYFEEHNVISIICGWDGYKMTGKTFFLI